jgi:hypothetical protein
VALVAADVARAVRPVATFDPAATAPIAVAPPG